MGEDCWYVQFLHEPVILSGIIPFLIVEATRVFEGMLLFFPLSYGMWDPDCNHASF